MKGFVAGAVAGLVVGAAAFAGAVHRDLVFDDATFEGRWHCRVGAGDSSGERPVFCTIDGRRYIMWAREGA